MERYFISEQKPQQMFTHLRRSHGATEEDDWDFSEWLLENIYRYSYISGK